ncbi:hypothetical protein [Solidesulfovibrio sp.]
MTSPQIRNPFAAALMALHGSMAAGLGPMTDSGPALVARLLQSLVAATNNGIAAPLRQAGQRIAAVGVAVPARPQVAFVLPGQPGLQQVPLGDLLLVARHRHGAKPAGTTALLLHVSKNARVPFHLRDASQKYFLAHWPPFRYAGTSPDLEGCPRHVRGPHLHLGSRLLCLVSASDADMPCACLFPQGMPLHCQKSVVAQAMDPEPAGYTCLAHELLHFIGGNAGRAIAEPAPGDAGFDRVVAELVSATVRRAARPDSGCRLTGSRTVARSLGLGHDAAAWDTGTTPSRPIQSWPEADAGGGISLICFDTETL